MLKKIFISFLITISPSVFIIATTPFSQLSEHIAHILLFTVMGFGMAGYYLRNDIKEKKARELIPSLSTLTILVAFVFIATHAMPCPYMFSPHSAQTMIDHPCSQPTTPSLPLFSFNHIPERLVQFTLPDPVMHVISSIQTLNNKAPPLA